MIEHRCYAEQAYGLTVHVHGIRVCTLSTLKALERLGLVVPSGRWTWELTDLALAATYTI